MFLHVKSTNSLPIGEQNILAVEKALARSGIPILGRHLGGSFGRRMIVDVETGSVQIHLVGQPSVRI